MLLDKCVGSVIVGRNLELRMTSMNALQCSLGLIESKLMSKSLQAK